MLFCNNCGKHFKVRRDLERHNMRQNLCKIPSYFCPICNKGLNSRHTLYQHQKICSSSKISKGIEGSGVLPMIVTSSKTKKENNEDITDYTDEECNNNNKDSATQNVSNTFIWKVDDGIRKNHCFFLPKDIRGIIVGKSGFGKTTLLNYLLLEPDVLDYNRLLVCGNSLHQPEYRIMNAAFAKKLSKNQIKTIFEHQREAMNEGGPEKVIQEFKGNCKGDIDADFYTDVTKIPDPANQDPAYKNLLILDDIMLDSQSKAEAYYTRGRHNNFDVFYISQSYFRLPRQTIRENANFFIFFLQDKKNLSHIYNDHCASDDISYETFAKFCSNVWNEDKHNFVTIDLTRSVDGGKYRKNLTEYWSPLYDKMMGITN